MTTNNRAKSNHAYYVKNKDRLIATQTKKNANLKLQNTLQFFIDNMDTLTQTVYNNLLKLDLDNIDNILEFQCNLLFMKILLSIKYANNPNILEQINSLQFIK